MRKADNCAQTAPEKRRVGSPWRRVLFVCAAVLIMAFGSATPKAAELLMFESEGCSWCEVWNEEIAPVYPKTDEAKSAPLRRVDLDEERPSDLTSVQGIVYTPTFVLWRDGKEIGRIVGFPGESNFWELLDELIRKMNATSTAKRAPAAKLQMKACATC